MYGRKDIYFGRAGVQTGGVGRRVMGSLERNGVKAAMHLLFLRGAQGILRKSRPFKNLLRI
jgi:hypothetical protein